MGEYFLYKADANNAFLDDISKGKVICLDTPGQEPVKDNSSLVDNLGQARLAAQNLVAIFDGGEARLDLLLYRALLSFDIGGDDIEVK